MYRRAKKEKETRSKHREELTNRILRETVILLREQGYEKTTMRQIAAKCDILTGSLYNIFPSKADIIKNILIRGFNMSLELSKKTLEDDDGLLMNLAFPLGLSLHMAASYENVPEIFNVAMGSWDITKSMIDVVGDWVKQQVAKFNMTLNFENMESHLLALFGSINAFATRLRIEKTDDYSIELVSIMRMFCTLFSISDEGIEDVAKRMNELMRSKDYSPIR